MGLVTVSDVEAYTGVTYDSEASAVVSSVIDAVSAWVECYTGQKFTDAAYAERIDVIDNYFSVKSNVQYFYGAYYDRNPVIKVTCPDASSSINVDLDAKEVKVFDLSLLSTIDISSITIAGLNTAINALAGFSSSLESEVNSGLPALTVYDASYGPDPENSNILYLYAANEPMGVSRASGKLYSTNVECASGIAIYQGGYTTLPADLTDAIIRFVIKAYQDRTVTAASGTKKSEKIGDYSYTNFSSSEETAGLGTLAVNYYSVLNCYRSNLSI